MNMISTSDTIAAISTPLGEGGIAIVRISGRDALDVADKVFRNQTGKDASSMKSHTVQYGSVTDEERKEIIDEVILTVMRSPRSYTGEDVVEINCHGGNSTVKRVLGICLEAGARLAEPGEFTKRAFLNGRIDLSQAEAVIDIIRSETEVSRKVAFNQLNGVFSERIKSIRSATLDALSLIELSIDFSDEDVDFATRNDIVSRTEKVTRDIEELLKTADRGIVLREGASVVICGRPNVGKSSLMNALLKDDRVIVTPVAGTTRDTIEESINLNGVKVRLADTAGIIDTKDRVELEGIKRAREKLEQSDIAVFVVDASRSLSERDINIYDTVKDKKVTVVLNKTDLKTVIDKKKLHETFGSEIIEVSALKKIGLDKLENAISHRLFGDRATKTGESVMVTSLRHKDALLKAFSSMKRTAANLDGDCNRELIASDINETIYNLGLITGETVEDDVLDRIFSNFCIGK
ncbi:MAG: tRNA uridine-5-carboxymethylaminomethyl(34) synthesis GTPase MnmE [Candidatus Aadella gelida]|nr:tRNA uridine-5-carboxymethylaminomethyl(34) synthesis GTPase MnmE [Candidatus Aadella gelida]